MALSAGGIGSGLDVNGIVAKLMQLERQPLQRLQSQKSDVNAQISAYGKLNSALSTFQSAMSDLASVDKFQLFSATSSNEDSFTATTDTTASAASHSIQVEALANAHKFTSNNGGATSYADENTSIGTTGTLELSQGGSSFQITIDGTNDTLAGIRNAINDATDNTGLTASIVNTGSEARLVLTADETGTANEITVGAGTTASVATALDLGTIAGNEAADAGVIIDGISITSSSNTITDAISGVTLDLHSAAPGVSESLTIARDTDKVKESVQSFVDAYNDLHSALDKYGGEGGILQGDSALLSIERQLRGVMNNPASGFAFSYLSEVGISTDSVTGEWSLDSTELGDAINSNFSDFASLFGDATEGFAVRFEAVADSLVSSDGLIDSREDGLNSRLSTLENREDNLNYRLELIEERYQKQFAALDSFVAQMNSTGSFLGQQLAGLPAPNSI